MTNKLDLRGLSCPQPVFETKKKIEAMGKGELLILVDTGTARDNITRLAVNNGWSISVNETGGDFELTLKK